MKSSLLEFIIWMYLCFLNIRAVLVNKNDWILSLCILGVIICILNMHRLINDKDA